MAQPFARRGASIATLAVLVFSLPHALADERRRASPAGSRGASLAASPDGRRLYVADTDNDSLVIVDPVARRALAWTAVGDGPEQVLVAADGSVFTSLRWAGQVVALEPGGQRVRARADVGVEPWGLALSPDGTRLYVGSAQSRTLTALDARTLAPVWTVPLPDEEPRGVAVTPDGRRAFVVHLRAPRITEVELAGGRVSRQIDLHVGDPSDVLLLERLGVLSEEGSFERGAFARIAAQRSVIAVPNRALAVQVSRDGRHLFAAFDVKRNAPLGDGSGAADREVFHSLAPETGGYGAGAPSPIAAFLAILPIAAPNAPVAFVELPGLLDPADLQLDPSGRLLTIVGAGPNSLTFDVTRPERPHLVRVARIGWAEASAVAAGGRWFHDAIRFQLRPEGAGDAIPIGVDPLPAPLAAGRVLFHDRTFAISNQQFACQSCHPDGRQDGITWNIDLGPRQTPILAGHVADTAPYHWLGSAPTLEDSIRETVARLEGGGLSPVELAGIAAYVRDGLHPIPHPTRTGAPPTAEEERGRALFESEELGCGDCHMPGSAFQSGQQELLGLGRPGSSDALRRFDVPSLRDLHASAPYLHDGSAPDLESVLVAFNHDDRMGNTRQLSRRDLSALIAYLESL